MPWKTGQTDQNEARRIFWLMRVGSAAAVAVQVASECGGGVEAFFGLGEWVIIRGFEAQ